MTFRTSARIAALLALPVLVEPVHAQLTTYTSSAAFLAASGPLQMTETYEGLAAGTVIADGSTVNGITYSAFPVNTDGLVIGTFNSIGALSLHAMRTDFPALSFFFPGESFTVTFPTPVTAVGLFFNIGSSPTVSNYVFTTTPVGTAFSGGATPDTSTLFFAGLTSATPFSTATFGATAGAPSGFNVDNLTYAPVPEPTSIGLLGLGLVAFGARHRRKR